MLLYRFAVAVGLYPLVKIGVLDLIRERKVGTEIFVLIAATLVAILGRAPWLPAFVAKRSMARADFSALATRIVPWLVRAETLLRPRLAGLARPPMEHVLGLLALVLAVVLVLPIPLGMAWTSVLWLVAMTLIGGAEPMQERRL